MLSSKTGIMNTGWLNMVFAGRNQAYGAYELRRNNAQNTNRALLIATGTFVFILASPTIYNKVMGFIPKADPVYTYHVIKLLPPPTLPAPHPLPPLPRQATAIPQHSTIAFPPPIVKPDPQTSVEPPTQTQLAIANPGDKTVQGQVDGNVNIDEEASNVKSASEVGETDENVIFHSVEVSPLFPGGEEAFAKFLQTHIKYPAMARDNGISGRAFISFVVERDGSLTDIKSVRDPGSGLDEEAIRVLKMSPHWTPGIQNGKKVRVSYTVPVNFSLGEQ